jgi:cell division protein FtsL
LIVAKNSRNNNQYIVYGSQALDTRRLDRYEDTNQNANKRAREQHKRKVKKQMKLIGLTLGMLLMGTVIIGRYSIIMNLNNQCSSIHKDIAKNQSVNENLKLELAKYDNIRQIEKAATAELNMVRPAGSNMVSISVKSSDIKSQAEKDEEQPKKVSLLGRIINFFN